MKAAELAAANQNAEAVEELTATIEDVNSMAVENANGVSLKTNQAAEEAQLGQQSMKELVNAKDKINEVSIEIQNIIGTIEDIASQTNLLSLSVY